MIIIQVLGVLFGLLGLALLVGGMCYASFAKGIPICDMLRCQCKKNLKRDSTSRKPRDSGTAMEMQARESHQQRSSGGFGSKKFQMNATDAEMGMAFDANPVN